MFCVESPQRDDEDKRMTPPPISGESAAFRQAMREFAAGVSIVACGAGEARSGCTVTALTSLSLANCLIVLPETSESIAEGEEVDVELI